MTYCLAIRTPHGLVFASDTRSNAGVDYVVSYRKLHPFECGADRSFVLLSAGSLATTQEVVSWLQRDLEASDGRENLNSANMPFEAAAYVGRTSRAVQMQHSESLSSSGVSGEATFIFGGQIQGHEPEIFLIYPQGNYIHASADTPYLQIGEAKYGKPMLDRLCGAQLGLEEAARLALISLDATVRSNVTVGLPLDVAAYPTDSLTAPPVMRFDENMPYLRELRTSWQASISQAFSALAPMPQFTVAPQAMVSRPHSSQ